MICKNFCLAHQNVFEMGMSSQLHPLFEDKRTNLPPTGHTLFKNREIDFMSMRTGY